MYIMHFVSQWENCDNQVIEVRAGSRSECVQQYIQRCIPLAPMTITALGDGRIVWESDEELCIMRALNEHIVYTWWVLK